MTWQALALVAALTFSTVVAVVVHELTWEEPVTPPSAVTGKAKVALDRLKPFLKAICDHAPTPGSTLGHTWPGEYSFFLACVPKERT